MKSYQSVEDGYEELITPTEYIDDNVLTKCMGMVDLIKNYRKLKLNYSKDKCLYVYRKFIFVSVTRAEKLFSHCKYIKKRQIFEAIGFLKSNRELW